ncbi:MAG: GEVED domain-containing protein [Chitinophagales bacterium]
MIVIKTTLKLLIATVLFTSLFVQASYAQNIDSTYWDGKIYLKLKNETHFDIAAFKKGDNTERLPDFLQEMVATYDIKHIKRAFPLLKSRTFETTYEVAFAEFDKVDNFVKTLEGNSTIEYAEKVPYETLCFEPNDPKYSSSQKAYLQSINAPQAWDMSFGSSEIVVAVVDDAILQTHEDLSSILWDNPNEIAGNGIDDDNNGYIDDVHGWDMADSDNNTNPPASETTSSTFSHGTHVSGLACASTNNGKGGASLGSGASLMAIKATSDNASNPNAIQQGWHGIEYAIENGADVINLSWGGTAYSSTHANICNYAEEQGVVIVAAAGNYGISAPFYPAAYETVIAVAAVNSDGIKPGFSNYGDWINIAAPGVLLESSVASGNSSYSYKNGTSMASPVVAGAVALLLSYQPIFPPECVRQCLLNSAKNIDVLNSPFAGMLGTGMLDMFATLECANSCMSPFNITATNINAGNATLAWSMTGENVVYQGRIREVGAYQWSTFETTNTTYNYGNIESCKTYEFQLRTNCESSESNYTASQSFKVSGTPLIYCEMSAGSSNGEWIEQVILNDINQFSGSNDGYTDFTCEGTTTLTATNTYEMSLIPGYASTPYQEHWLVAIDFNQDGDFEDNDEIVFDSETTSNSTVTASITVPEDALEGETTMRVMMKWVGFNSLEAPEICMTPDVFKFGEVEDYKVVVASQQSINCVSPINMSANNMTENSADISWTSFAGENNATIQYRPNTSAIWLYEYNVENSPYTLGNLDAGTTYEYQIISNCSNNNSNASALATFTTVEIICNAPVNLTAINIAQTTATIDWAASANSYEVKYRVSGTTDWTTTSTNSTFLNIDDLMVGATYEYAIRAFCGADASNTSDFSATQTFETEAATCQYPNNINVTSYETAAVIAWETISIANSYTIRYKTIGGNWTTTSTANDTKNLTNLTPNTVYEYQIRSNCSTGIGEYSELSSFTTLSLATCETPSNITYELINSNSVDISWETVNNAVSYKLEYKTANSNTWSAPQFSVSSSKILNDLLEGTNYEVRMRTTCSAGNSNYSEIISFTTATDCFAPQNIVTANITETSVNVSWNESEISSYNLRFRPQGNDNWSPLSASSNTQTISGLNNNTTYELQVSSYCGNAVYSDYSPSIVFTTASAICGIPNGLGTGTVTSDAATLTWANIASATSYDIKVKATITSVWEEYTSTSPTLTVTNLNASTPYHFKVKASCSPDFSSSSIFITPSANSACGNPINLIAQDITPTTANLTWENPAAANSFIIKCRMAGQPATTETLFAGSNTTPLNSLLPNTDYEFQVKGVCGSSSSNYTVFIGFKTTSAGSCPVPTNVTVSDITNTSVSISYDNIDDASNFQIEYRQSGDATWNTKTSTNNSITLNELNSCGSYEVRLKSICDAGVSTYSDTQTFSTLCIVSPLCEAKGLNANHEWIERVVIANIDNVSGSNGGYGDFKQDFVAEVARNQNYPITLKAGFATSSYNEYWRVWIDYNQDGDFEDNEELAFDAGSVSPNAINAAISIPSFATLGETTMRIAMKYNAAPTACEIFPYGEVEDYTINIIDGTVDEEPDYCDATSNNAISEWIESFAIANINNVSGSNGGYGDFTSQQIEVNAGSSYEIAMSPGFAGNAYNEYWRIWIDFNQNAAFDDDEIVYDSEVVSNSAVSDFIQIPETALEGVTRLRIVMKYNGATSSCGTFNYGEVEDYNININSEIVASMNPVYCESGGNNANSEWIETVDFANIHNVTASDGGYGDYTNLIAEVGNNETYDLTLGAGFAQTAFNEYWSVWIDFNHDGDFDDEGELVFDAGAATQEQITASIHIPVTAPEGQTRMRVAMRYKYAPEACGSFNFGEVEDYTVHISTDFVGRFDNPDEAGTAAVNECSQLKLAFEYEVNGKEVHFINASEGDYDTIFWSFGDGEMSEEKNPIHTYENIGDYFFNVTISDSETGCLKTFPGFVHAFEN